MWQVVEWWQVVVYSPAGSGSVTCREAGSGGTQDE